MAVKTDQSLSREYEQLKALLRHVRSKAVDCKSENRVNTLIFEYLPVFVLAVNRLQNLRAGLAAYAAEQESDQNYDVVSEFVAARSAITQARNRLGLDVPKSSGGFVECYTIDEVTNIGELIYNTMSPSELSGLHTALDAVIAAID